MGADKLLPQIDPNLSDDAEPGKSLVKRRREIFLERYLPALRAFPGASDLVRALHEGRTCIVASSASEAEREPLLRIAGVEGEFEHAIKPDEVEGSKPEPGVVAAALAKSKTEPGLAVMIGDTSYDVAAATQAGVRCVALRCGGSSDEDLAGAAAIFDTPADFLQALRESDLETILAGGRLVS